MPRSPRLWAWVAIAGGRWLLVVDREGLPVDELPDELELPHHVRIAYTTPGVHPSPPRYATCELERLWGLHAGTRRLGQGNAPPLRTFTGERERRP